MTVIETRTSVWEALAGRAPGVPAGPADPGMWQAVIERLNPARARPALRAGVEVARLTSVRGVEYVMLRSPDQVGGCYLRLTPEEWELANLCDGTRTVARLVAEFARITGRLAPDHITRVVADLAANRMLDELPVNVFRPLDRAKRRPWPIRLGRGLLATARGRRVVLASVDPLVGMLYRAGGRLLFTRAGAVLAGVLALVGLALFGWAWVRGAESVFLTDDSYATGAAVLLGLNVFALGCHELGHALAAKHAGRRVPAAGLLVYFGIPSVFVDTTDVWMAGRRARLVTTVAGPAAGLVLAGIAQLTALVYPPAAPWAFKLCFAWYVNALFNLNPFLALDGYYLLMDWLEIPNLRTRGLAWVLARLRRRRPAFAELDREGRLVALYGMLAVVWLLIAGNIAYRIYADRVAGLVVGLWRVGWPARALLVAVIIGLASPVVYVGAGWFARGARRFRDRLHERRTMADAPRRLAALRSSPFGSLPAAVLGDLAARARWVRPRAGSTLVFAGSAQPDVYVVVEGAVEGRRPGDPAGMVRERVGPGGAVGLASALTGAPATLNWLTAGTRLLAVPAAVVAHAVGPLTGLFGQAGPVDQKVGPFGGLAGGSFGGASAVPSPAERAELEDLLAHVPALSGLSEEGRLAVIARARLTALPPGAPVLLTTLDDAVVVAAGAIEVADGTQLRRGALVGPLGEGDPRAVAVARTPARTCTLPTASGLALLPGPRPAAAGAANMAPMFGAHPPAAYPPLQAPPGPPPDVSDATDRRLEHRLRWLLLALLLLALLISAGNLLPGPAWAEMPTGRALVTGLRGTTYAVVAGQQVALGAGDKVYVGVGDEVRAGARSGAWLTFRGGSRVVLCAGTDVRLGEIRHTGGGLTGGDGGNRGGGRRVRPAAAMRLDAGRLLVDTRGTSGAFAPLDLIVGTGAGPVSNSGAARYVTAPAATVASSGEVALAGVRLPPTGVELNCGDGVSLPVTGSADPTRGSPPGPGPSGRSDPSSALPSPSVSQPGPDTPTEPGPGRTPTDGTSGRPSAQPSVPSSAPASSSAPPLDRTPPKIGGVSATPLTVYHPTYCSNRLPRTVTVAAQVNGVDDDESVIRVRVEYTFVNTQFSGRATLVWQGNESFAATIGPFYQETSDRITLRVYAIDDDGNTAGPVSTNPVSYSTCPIG